MFLRDSFLNIRNWINYFNPQVECLKHSSVHLEKMVKELNVPLFKCIQYCLITCGSEMFFVHVISRLGLELPKLVYLDVGLGNECSLRETFHEQRTAKNVFIALIGCCYTRNCK